MSAPEKRNAAQSGRTGGAGQSEKQQSNGNSASSQRQRIADHLLKHGALDTETARMVLDIYHPPARIKELRDLFGWAITTVFIWRETASCGRPHRVGKYLLVKAGEIG
ncbi:helix-turn-helix domain-containing protein [Thiomonas sp.]|jgi:hypothetical protein|uniref:helix-turn-helix domain-containing protein n=1 Tax=Thiomonas sp. TaxID=2047785 RepID=UPI001769286D|nr:helix-turn-helix domain-containing protein [Thiomonas sp.]